MKNQLNYSNCIEPAVESKNSKLTSTSTTFIAVSLLVQSEEHLCALYSIRLNYIRYYIRLTAFFQGNLGKPAPEKQNRYGKTNLDLLEQETVSGSCICWAICKSAPRLR